MDKIVMITSKVTIINTYHYAEASSLSHSHVSLDILSLKYLPFPLGYFSHRYRCGWYKGLQMVKVGALNYMLHFAQVELVLAHNLG